MDLSKGKGHEQWDQGPFDMANFLNLQMLFLNGTSFWGGSL